MPSITPSWPWLYAYLGRSGDASAAAANVKKLDPTWIAERYLSEAGGYAEKEAELFVDGARRAGLSDCVHRRQAQGHAQSDPRQVLRPATRQDVWVTTGGDCEDSAQSSLKTEPALSNGSRRSVQLMLQSECE